MGARGGVSRRRRALRIVGIGVLAVVMVCGLTAAYLYRHWNGNITGVAVGKHLGTRPTRVFPPGPDGPINVLVMGLDTREGDNDIGDGEKGKGGSDTTILLHLSADRTRAYGVSIPRDSMVDRPACLDEDGKESSAAESYVMWNDAFATGGPFCTIRQFEQLTGIRIDHWVVVDFHGFKDMVNAVGGVDVCIPEDWDDGQGIKLTKGTRRIYGDEALDYVRIRHIGVTKSDTDRVKRQQAFIGSMAKRVVSGSTLANPWKVVKFLNAATASLTMDEDLADLRSIAVLATKFKHIGLDKIQMLTAPWMADPRNPTARITWAPEAATLWNELLHDRPLSASLMAGAIGADRAPGADDSLPASPSPGSPASSGTPSGTTTTPSSSSSETTAQQQALKQAGLCA